MTKLTWLLGDEVFMILKGKTLMPVSEGVPEPALAAMYKTTELARKAADKIAEKAGAVLHPNDRDANQ